VISHQNHVFIDPSDCGSEVGYYITTSEYTDKKTQKTEYSMSATVMLSDCARKIDWSFRPDTEDSVDKIDAAISMLQEFRKKYITTMKSINAMNGVKA
jgi:hypothetical protein